LTFRRCAVDFVIFAVLDVSFAVNSCLNRSLFYIYLYIRRGRTTTTHYIHHQVRLVVSRNTAKFTNVTVAGFRKCRDLVGEDKVLIKNKAKVASRVGCSERRVVYFRKLLFKSDKKKPVLYALRVRRLAVIQEEICFRAFCK